MGFSWNTAVTACGRFEVKKEEKSTATMSSDLDFAFVLWVWAADTMTPSDPIVCFGQSQLQSVHLVRWRTDWKSGFTPLLFFFRDVEVPQSGDWWILGTLKGGHKERSEHRRWRWHDSNFTGCLPRTYRCPSAHLQQRVSVTHSFKTPLLNSTIILSNLTNFSFNY